MLETHPEWIVPLPGTPSPASGRKAFWMSVARCVNRLASSDKLLTVDPMALRIQRLYLDRCQKMSDACRDSPDWVLRILDDWEQTLGAMASNDHTWLASHLDPWIKHSLMIEYLRRIGSNWFDASTNLGLASELALLHQSYHTIAGDPSIFDAFEHAGMLQHRNRVNIRPGEEPNPFVPESLTRSSVRAKFIREHADEAGWIVDWATARNLIDGRQVAFEPPIQSRPRGD